MLKLINESKSAVVVVHEIYGINEHIRSVCNKYFTMGFDVFCPNLLDLESPYNYNQEDEAYNHFMTNIGFEKSYYLVKELLINLRKKYTFVLVVGYSVGATIAWLCSNGNYLCDAVIGFYGSRIREYLEVTPKCPVLLLFPEVEKSVCINDLIISLNSIKKVQALKMEGRHGFADPYSKNYVEDTFKQAEIKAIQFVEETKNYEKRLRGVVEI